MRAIWRRAESSGHTPHNNNETGSYIGLTHTQIRLHYSNGKGVLSLSGLILAQFTLVLHEAPTYRSRYLPLCYGAERRTMRACNSPTNSISLLFCPDTQPPILNARVTCRQVATSKPSSVLRRSAQDGRLYTAHARAAQLMTQHCSKYGASE